MRKEELDRQTDRQTSTQSDRPTGGRTDKHAVRQTDRQGDISSFRGSQFIPSTVALAMSWAHKNDCRGKDAGIFHDNGHPSCLSMGLDANNS